MTRSDSARFAHGSLDPGCYIFDFQLALAIASVYPRSEARTEAKLYVEGKAFQSNISVRQS